MISRKLLYLAGMAALGSYSIVADAGFYSGKELYEICTTERNNSAYVEKTYECIAYITGAVDAFNTTREVNKLKSCIPHSVTISQLREATVDYMRKNPDDLDASASKLVFAATRGAWPCGKKKQK